MAFADTVALIVGCVIVCLTMWEIGRSRFRRRDQYQSDLLLNVAVLAGILLFGHSLAAYGAAHPYVGFILSTFFLGQPYLLLRLVARFRPVPAFMRETTMAAALGGAAMAVLAAPGSSNFSTLITSLYFVVMLSYASWAFGQGARRTSGVGSRRLWYAAAGTWLHVLIAVLAAVGAVTSPPGPFARIFDASSMRLIGAGVFACYYIAFVGPARWRQAWTRDEIYRYFHASVGRGVEDRARHVADDLVQAASRSVAASAAAVMLTDPRHSTALVIRAATQPAWIDHAVVPANGLVGRALAGAASIAGGSGDCEPELLTLVHGLGDHVRAVPIVSAGRRWGALLVIERHGSLFPDDDVELLTSLCRYAAAALDHDRLMIDERDRLRRAVDRNQRDADLRAGVVLESLADVAVLVLDDHGRVLSSHGGAEGIFGGTARELRGARAAPWLGRSIEELHTDLDEATRAGRLAIDAPCRRLDGLGFHGSTIIRPMRPTSGGPAAFVAITRDVTARRTKELQERESVKMDAIARLASGVAGALDPLMDVIRKADPSRLASAELLQRDLGDIRLASDRVGALVSRLIAIGQRRAEAPREVSLNGLIDQILPALRRSVGDEVTIDFQPSDAVPEMPALADPGAIEQIVTHLVLNARDAMPMGGRISLRTDNALGAQHTADANLSPGAYVVLTIADNGQGMNADTKSRIFEPFFSTKAMGPGSGLGLSLVYGLVTQMGGGVTVDSEPGHGATFRVYLPALPAATEVRRETGRVIDASRRPAWRHKRASAN
jgi:PAS domain S-box-containing protein